MPRLSVTAGQGQSFQLRTRKAHFHSAKINASSLARPAGHSTSRLTRETHKSARSVSRLIEQLHVKCTQLPYITIRQPYTILLLSTMTLE